MCDFLTFLVRSILHLLLMYRIPMQVRVVLCNVLSNIKDLCSHKVPQHNLHVRYGIVVVGFDFEPERKDEEQFKLIIIVDNEEQFSKLSQLASTWATLAMTKQTRRMAKTVLIFFNVKLAN
jgi:hypothetical protein